MSYEILYNVMLLIQAIVYLQRASKLRKRVTTHATTNATTRNATTSNIVWPLPHLIALWENFGVLTSKREKSNIWTDSYFEGFSFKCE